ncbi:MAG: xanthine dehydrogenase family protein [Deltaproteobacteria bacterium]|nr:xanthine dehydrogenase family protein [Deltaproteobacteria bacterium]
MGFQTVGKSIWRLDGEKKVRGQALYTIDLKKEGMLHGRILRSPVPHARLVRVDTSEAARLAGVHAVLSRDDFPEGGPLSPFFGRRMKDKTVVALDKVRHVGDVVAAVAAVDVETADQALRLIEVEYDELPLVSDPVAAIEAESPQLFDHLPEIKNNICHHTTLKQGDIDKGFEESDIILEDTFRTPVAQHCHLEPHMALAWFDESGRLIVHTGTQTPYGVRKSLAEIFRMPEEQIRVVVPYVGGAYGAKSHLKVEHLAAALAWKAKRPVRIQLRREEVFLTVTKHASVVRMKTGAKKDGTLMARKAELYYDTGAFAENGPNVVHKATLTSTGPYRIPHIQADGFCILTNKPSAGAFRGYGVPQVALAYETHMDALAERLGLDPVEVRIGNLLREGDRHPTGATMHSVGYEELLRKLGAAIQLGARRKGRGKRRRGRGIACMIKASNTETQSEAKVQANRDGTFTVLSASVEMGQGAETVMAQIAAEELGVRMKGVTFVPQRPDTDLTPFDAMTTASRSTFCMGNAVRRAAKNLRDRLVEFAADLMEISPQDLRVDNGRIFAAGAESKGFTYKEVAARYFARNQEELIGKGFYGDEEDQKTVLPFWLVGGCAVELEVDTETGAVKLRKLVAGSDAGKAINPRLCEGQVRGDATIGIGQALLEELQFVDGQPVNASFLHYTLPSFQDVPDDFPVILVEQPHKDGPFGAKGLAESALPAVPAAIANALHDALGVRIKRDQGAFKGSNSSSRFTSRTT